MKKQNNRFRNGNNNNCYTLNYKFDSVSIAGKISGTALELIRKYNDLAKEAQGQGNYVDMEIYRQYAEHYRKIVTDINERRQTRQDNQSRQDEGNTVREEENREVASQTEEVADSKNENVAEEVTPVAEANGYVETLPATETPQKSFQVVEITEKEEAVKEVKPKRVYRKRTPKKVAEA